jgi:methanogenic corrinoid protein MtbC1
MEKRLKKFLHFLDEENKDEAILFIHKLLDDGASIIDIYEHFIIPSLRDYHCNSNEEEICIWKEHTRTSIIRTILESTYPYLIQSKKEKKVNQFIVVACPQEEYHEIGAIISANYFNLMGFDVKYIGANTPSFEIKSAIKIMEPDFLALSVSNDYNLIQTKKLIESLKSDFPQLKIILGGRAAMLHAKDVNVQYDYLLNSLDDIQKFRGDFS